VSEFEEHACRSVAAALEDVPPAKAAEVYAVSLLVYDEEDDPRRPTITVGTNTETRVRERIARGDDPGWARWNFAYWIQDDLAVVGDSARDPEGARLRRRWIEELGLWYSDEDERRDFEATEQPAARITSACSAARSRC
jgi:hypothetical protein